MKDAIYLNKLGFRLSPTKGKISFVQENPKKNNSKIFQKWDNIFSFSFYFFSFTA